MAKRKQKFTLPPFELVLPAQMEPWQKAAELERRLLALRRAACRCEFVADPAGWGGTSTQVCGGPCSFCLIASGRPDLLGV